MDTIVRVDAPRSRSKFVVGDAGESRRHHFSQNDCEDGRLRQRVDYHHGPPSRLRTKRARKSDWIEETNGGNATHWLASEEAC